MLWPTPGAMVSNDGETPETWLARAEALKAKGYNANGAGMPLAIASQLWPTPAARDVKGENSATHLAQDRGHHDQLPNAVAMWPSPTAGDAKASGSRNLEGSAAHAGVSLTDLVLSGGSTTARSSRPALPTSTAGASTSLERRTLNPLFVEALMGWPEGWSSASTDSGVSAMAWSRWLQRMRSALSRLEQG